MPDVIVRTPSLMNPFHNGIIASPYSSTGRSSEDSLRQGLVGAWSPASTGPTGGRLYDLSGRGNHGTLTNMDPGTDWVGQSVNGSAVTALDFDGVNDYVTIKPVLLSTQTISFWVKSKAQSDNRVYGLGSDASNNQVYAIGTGNITPARMRFLVRNNSGTALIDQESSADVFDSKWHFVCLSDETGSVKLFVDSRLSNTWSYAYESLALNRSSIGALLRASPQFYFNGIIAELNVYNRAVSTSEILQLYQLGPGWLTRPKQRASVFSVALPPAGGDISGSSSITFSTAATLTGSGALTGTSSLTLSTSATLTGSGALTGSSSITFATAGTLTGSGEITASSSVTFSPSGTLTDLSTPTGSSSITFATSGTLTGSGAITGSSSLTVANAGTLAGSGAMVTSSSVTFSTSGTLTGSVAMTGSSSLTLVASGTLSGLVACVGASGLVVSGAGTMSGAGLLVGVVGLVVDASGDLAGTGYITAASSVTFTLDGLLESGIPPSVPGAEYTAPDDRLHYSATGPRLHYTAPEE